MRGWQAAIGLVALAVLVGPGVAASAGRAEWRKPGPPRIVFVGDSISITYEQRAAELFRSRGWEAIKAGAPATGLLDRGICKGGYARRLESYVDPDVVVILHSGNWGIRRSCTGGPYGSPNWLRQWKIAAEINQMALARRGARVLWIEAPSANFVPKRELVPKLNAIYRDIGETVDAYTAFGGATYDQSLRYDTQHLNAKGADKLARLVLAEVENQN